jgi:hypothetical protein
MSAGKAHLIIFSPEPVSDQGLSEKTYRSVKAGAVSDRDQ